MSGMQMLNGASDVRPQFAGRRAGGSFLNIEAWMPKTKDKDLTRTRCLIPPVSITPAPTAEAASG